MKTQKLELKTKENTVQLTGALRRNTTCITHFQNTTLNTWKTLKEALCAVGTLSAPTEAGHVDNRNKLHYQPKDYFHDFSLNVQDLCKKQQVLVDYTTGIGLFYMTLWPTVKVKDEKQGGPTPVQPVNPNGAIFRLSSSVHEHNVNRPACIHLMGTMSEGCEAES